MMSGKLEIKNAYKCFVTPEGDKVNALDNVDISVSENEFLTLLGPSGCGKTTLLRVISGFEDLDQGDILLDNISIAHQPAYRRPVNTVFQKYALFPHLSVAKNIAYSLELAGNSKKEIANKVTEALELVQLAGLGDRKIAKLSGGQQQRIALARALVAKPKILLLDEPLSALDKNLRQEMQQELKSIQHAVGISFIFVTHDQEEALTMSDRIAVLGDGKVQQLGTPKDIYAHPNNAFVARFIGESNMLPAVVKKHQGDTTIVATDNRQEFQMLRLQQAEGEKITLLARPENIYLGSSTDKNSLCFNGTIKEVYYTGVDYKVIVDSDELKGLKMSIRPEDSVNPTVGESISAYISKDNIHIIVNGDN